MNKSTLRTKIITYTVYMVLLTLSIVGIFFFSTFYKMLLTNAYKTLETSVSQTQTSMENNFNALDNMVYMILSDENIKQWLNKEESFLNNDPYTFSKINNLVNNLQFGLIFDSSWTSKQLESIQLYIDDKKVSLISRHAPFNSEGNDIYEKVLKEAQRSNKSSVFIPPNDSEKRLLFVKKISNYYSNDKFLIICEIRTNKFAEVLSTLPSYYEAVIVNEKNQICFSNKEELLGRELPYDFKMADEVIGVKGGYEITVNDDKYLFVRQRIDGSEFSINISISRKVLLAQVIFAMKNYALVMLVILCVLIVLVFLISSRYTRVIPDIINNLNRIREKNYYSRMPGYKDKQLNMISETFNRMSEEIETLINKVYVNRILLKDNELKLLQSQMSPHFLVNSMTIIGASALLRGEKETYESVRALNGLIGAKLLNTEEQLLVSIENELHYVEYYLYLQKLRFQERLQYSIIIEDKNVLECLVPRLSLEPIIENAVIHGIENNIKEGIVKIEIIKENDILILRVSDNGKGFDVTNFYEKSSKKSDERHHIGLKNTDKRIKIIFGNTYGLFIKSVIDEGTIVEIHMPLFMNLDDLELDKEAK